MKKLLIIIFIQSSICSNIYTQVEMDSGGVSHIIIHSIEWNLKSRTGIGIETFNKWYKYSFESDGSDLYVMFLDYSDCIEKLASQQIIPADSAGTSYIRDYVELQFGKKKKVELYFDDEGNYYFENKWHARNDCLYYHLFKYFSNILAQYTIIQEAEKKCDDPLWHWH